MFFNYDIKLLPRVKDWVIFVLERFYEDFTRAKSVVVVNIYIRAFNQLKSRKGYKKKAIKSKIFHLRKGKCNNDIRKFLKILIITYTVICVG